MAKSRAICCELSCAVKRNAETHRAGTHLSYPITWCRGMDPLTHQIVRQIERLPTRKKAALLELLRSEEPSEAASTEPERDAWKQMLLNTSVWTEDDLQAIHQVRTWMNQWTPPSS